MEEIKIGDRFVGKGRTPYIIAEIGANHNGDMDLCRKMIDSAKACGVDAVKFQSWDTGLISESVYSENTNYSDKKRHFGSLHEMVERYRLTDQQHRETADYCQEKGVDFLSSCFSRREVDLLEEIGVKAHKLASMDINNYELLEYVATTGKPVLLSTGMSSLSEIAAAVELLHQSNSGPVALFHCVSIYPPEMKDVHLNNIVMLRETFDLPVGFSDHTMGTAIPLAAIALGACVIEKHFTTNRDLAGWDHWISAVPEELGTIVREGKNIFQALGQRRRTVSQAELEKRSSFRRSLVAVGDKRAGYQLRLEDVTAKRPGTGIPPSEMKRVVGRRLRRDIKNDQMLSDEDFE